MANVDNANGFTPVKTLSGGPPAMVSLGVAASETLAKGDAVVLASGLVSIGLATSPQIFGVMAEDSAAQATSTEVLVYVADSNTVFEGQCSGNSAVAEIGTTCDIEGATGAMELNENATTEDVCSIIGHAPGSAIGANGRMQFVFARSSFNDYQDAE